MKQIFIFEFVPEWHAMEGDAAFRRGGGQVRCGGATKRKVHLASASAISFPMKPTWALSQATSTSDLIRSNSCENAMIQLYRCVLDLGRCEECLFTAFSYTEMTSELSERMQMSVAGEWILMKRKQDRSAQNSLSPN